MANRLGLVCKHEEPRFVQQQYQLTVFYDLLRIGKQEATEVHVGHNIQRSSQESPQPKQPRVRSHLAAE